MRYRGRCCKAGAAASGVRFPPPYSYQGSFFLGELVGQFLQLILDNLFKLWPYRIIDADCQGTRRFRGGMTLLLPGGHWFIPGLQQIDEYNVVYQNKDCGDQGLTTKDRVKITVSCNIGYRVIDLCKLHLQYQVFDDTLRNMARGIVFEVVTTTNYGDLLADPAAIQRALLAGLRKEFSGSGVKILDAKLDQLIESRGYRVFGPGPGVFA